MKMVSKVLSPVVSAEFKTAEDFRHDIRQNGSTGYSMSVTDLVRLYKNGIILGYGQNRKVKDVQRIVKEFNPYFMTAINIIDNQDGTFTIADGHHRMAALVLLVEKFPNSAINVLVGPKGLVYETFTKCNNTRNLSLLDKVSNKDGEIGSVLEKILKKASFGSTDTYSNAILPTLADLIVILATSDGKSKYDFADVCKKRNTVNAITKGIETLPVMTPSQELRLVKALKVYKLLMSNIEGQKNLNKDWKKLIKATGLFMFIMVDALNNGKLVDSCPVKITEKWLKNSTQVLAQSSNISRRNSRYLVMADVYKTMLNCKPY